MEGSDHLSRAEGITFQGSKEFLEDRNPNANQLGRLKNVLSIRIDTLVLRKREGIPMSNCPCHRNKETGKHCMVSKVGSIASPVIKSHEE